MGLARYACATTAVAAAGTESRFALPCLTDHIEDDQCNSNRQCAANNNGSHDGFPFSGNPLIKTDCLFLDNGLTGSHIPGLTDGIRATGIATDTITEDGFPLAVSTDHAEDDQPNNNHQSAADNDGSHAIPPYRQDACCPSLTTFTAFSTYPLRKSM